MIRLLVRFLGLMLLAAAFAALIIDGTRSIAANSLLLTPLGQTGMWLFPNKFPLLQPLIERNIHPLLWNPALLFVLRLPTWLCLGLIGAACLEIARRRPQPIGFSSRP
jgi:hypothetical protein